jgi:hypothetical protein
MRFISKDHNLNVLVEPEQKSMDKFNNVHIVGARYLHFRGAYYDTDDGREIDVLRGLPSFGFRVFEGIAPDNIVETGTMLPKYICGFPKCSYETFQKNEMKEHKVDEHSKAAREKKRAKIMAAREEADEAAEKAYSKNRKKKKKNKE